MLLRFIPTSVGNTHNSPPSPHPLPVHPHIRGEYISSLNESLSVYGSSPHPWGILWLCISNGPNFRFIPTSVGNTPADYLIHRAPPVHPHIRGEYGENLDLCRSLLGSSPHPWGILSGSTPHHLPPRFIPTSVGNTRLLECLCVSPAVHPHIRGEYTIDEYEFTVIYGSSPHPWGIQLI